jgi:hypothetical protein
VDIIPPLPVAVEASVAPPDPEDEPPVPEVVPPDPDDDSDELLEVDALEEEAAVVETVVLLASEEEASGVTGSVPHAVRATKQRLTIEYR